MNAYRVTTTKVPYIRKLLPLRTYPMQGNSIGLPRRRFRSKGLLPPEEVPYHAKLVNNRVTTERAPYNPKLHCYTFIPLRVIPHGFLRRGLRIIGRFTIMRFSHREECHRVTTEPVPYNPPLMNSRVPTEKALCNSTCYLYALIPWRGLLLGLLRSRLRII